MRRHLPGALAAALGLALLLVGCSDDKNDASSSDPLLGRADVSPLHPSSVRSVSESDSPAGTQTWSCGENEGLLVEDGWKFKIRDLRNTDDGWAVYSALLTNDAKSPTSVIDSARAQVATCNKQKPMYQDVGLREKDAYGYRSVGPDGRVDTVRLYAPVGDHRIVQLTLLGLNGQNAPDQAEDLLRKAVDKAEKAD
jgi:hypothetical protein